jgi:hypothetical protein
VDVILPVWTANNDTGTRLCQRLQSVLDHCAICGCGTWSRSPLWDRQTKRPVPAKFRVQVNAWLVEDFDPTPSRSRWLTAIVSGEREIGQAFPLGPAHKRMVAPLLRPVVIVVLIAAEMSRAASLFRHLAIRHQRVCYSG